MLDGHAASRGAGRAQHDDRARAFEREAWATKLYWPPTPLTTRPSSSPSETTAPSSVAIMALLMKRALTRARRLALLVAIELVDEGDRRHAQLRKLRRGISRSAR